MNLQSQMRSLRRIPMFPVIPIVPILAVSALFGLAWCNHRRLQRLEHDLGYGSESGSGSSEADEMSDAV